MSSRIKQCENGISELADKNAFKEQLLKGTLKTTEQLKKWLQYLFGYSISCLVISSLILLSTSLICFLSPSITLLISSGIWFMLFHPLLSLGLALERLRVWGSILLSCLFMFLLFCFVLKLWIFIKTLSLL